MQSDSNSDKFQEYSFDWATQYYIAARFSIFARFIPVSANLFHHAIEMYLKGYLAREAGVTPPNLKKKFGHRLLDLWGAFKSHVSDQSLDRFDLIIAELDKFESIRYPDDVLAKGMLVSINLKTDYSSSNDFSNKPEPHYIITVEEIDKLVKVIFEKSDVNPAYYTKSYSKHALTYLQQDNDSCI